MKEEDEDHEIQKPHIHITEDEQQMKDPIVNTILILELQITNKFMGNNYKSKEFGMQKSEDDLSRLSCKSIEVCT